jgi:deoxyribodipyrimidine photo-lyase
MRPAVPATRVRTLVDAPPSADRPFVLYWMIASRRLRWNFGLQRAVDWAVELAKPLVILEALRAGYPWASDRLHTFVVEGMAEHSRALARAPATYYPYLEPKPGDGAGLLERLAADSAVVVTDDYPAFFLPRMLAAARTRLRVRFEAVDSNGLLPMRDVDQTFVSAYQFRRYYQKRVLAEGLQLPVPDPLEGVRLGRLRSLPSGLAERWPMATADELDAPARLIAGLPIDHAVPAVSSRGGRRAAVKRLTRFVDECLDEYGALASQPEADRTSGLSPYLHFGHIAAHEVFDAVMRSRDVDLGDGPAGRATGKRHGFWGVDESTDVFLDELLVWRELGFNMCATRADYDRYESLPDWARATLDKHARDRRPVVYDLATLERAGTHDELWNAVQTQLVRDGWFHGYLRMLWAKKILQWSAHPREALTAMTELMNKYSLDGRGPNAYSGYFWTLGRYDRPWGPERPIFGKVRYMTSENTKRKLKLGRYLEEYGPASSGVRSGTLFDEAD